MNKNFYEYFNYRTRNIKSNKYSLMIDKSNKKNPDNEIVFEPDSCTYFVYKDEIIRHNFDKIYSNLDLEILILERINYVVADIKLKEEIYRETLLIRNPEVYICLINEYIDKNNTKDIIASNYRVLKNIEYTIDVLRHASLAPEEMSKLYDYILKSNKWILENTCYKFHRNSKLDEAIALENTPSSCNFNLNAFDNYSKKIESYFSKEILKKYNIALKSFIERNYIYYSRINSLFNFDKDNNLLEKLLFGKRITKDEYNILLSYSKIGYPILDYVNNQCSKRSLKK